MVHVSLVCILSQVDIPTTQPEISSSSKRVSISTRVDTECACTSTNKVTIDYVLQVYITAEFLYFGLRFCLLNAVIAVIKSIPSSFTFNELENSVQSQSQSSLKKFMDEIKADIQCLNRTQLGGKTGWQSNGLFKNVSDVTSYVYVYRHTKHAPCSSILLSVLERSGWGFTIKKEWLTESQTRCVHSNHYHLLPFFYENGFLKRHYQQVSSGDATNVVASLLTELDEIEQKMLDIDSESEFWHPGKHVRVNNWNENDWSRRLAAGINTFKIDAKFTAQGPFCDYLSTLGIRSFENCFIFRGFPDILLRNRKTSAIVVSGSVDANPDPNTSLDSSTDDSIVENSWQKHPLKGAQVDDLPEKLGEMLAGLYIVLMSKILRRLMKNKDIKKNFITKGVLLDKTTANVVCSMSLDLKNEVSLPQIYVTDCMGALLTPQSLCYLIRAVSSADSDAEETEPEEPNQ